MSLKSISNQSATCCNAQNTYLKIKLAQQNLTNMKFSDSTKQAIANATGLVYLADNLEKRAATDGEEVAKMLRFYCPTREAHQVIEETVLPDIKATNPGFDYPGSGDVPEPPVEEVLKALKASIVFDEASYNSIVDEEYRKQWTWEQSKPSMPWLVVDIEKTKEDAVVDLKMTAGNGAVVFAASCDDVGTRSEDSTTLSVAYARVMFECIKDLQVAEPWEQEFVVTGKNAETAVSASVMCPEKPAEPEPEKKLPEVTSTMEPNVVTDKDYEYEVATVPNDYEGTMVYAKMTTNALPEHINSIMYWEPNEAKPSWHELPVSEDGSYRFGSAEGFPLLAIASKFKLNMKVAGSYDFKVSIIQVEGDVELCSVEDTMSVTDKVAPTISTDLPASIEAGKDQEFGVTTVPNDFEGTMVYGLMTMTAAQENIEKLQYWEANEEVPSWHDFPMSESGEYRFGPKDGFPLMNLTSKFRVQFKKPGSSFTYTIAIKTIEDNKTLCSIKEQVEVTGKQSINSLNVAFVHDEATYNEHVDAAYREQYDFEASKDSMPWLVVDIDKADAEARPQLAIKAGNAEVVFAESCDNVGSRSNENKTLTLNANVAKYAMFECIKDLQVAEPFGIKWTVAAQVEDEAALSASVDAPAKQKAKRASKK